MALVKFTASNFEGNCTVDEQFVPYLERMNIVAVQHQMVVVVTSSFRMDTNVKGAIVMPAKRSNHLIGYAIDCNLKNLTTGEYYNSKKMKDGVGADELFCDDVSTSTGLRWGMAFDDSVHFDYPLNLRNPELWERKYRELHSL